MKNLGTGWFLNGPSRNERPRRRRHLGQLNLEALEGRVVLSTYTVNSLVDTNPPAGVMTLRQAITAANKDHNTNPANPDIINITVDGTIALGSALPALTGSVAIEGPGVNSLTIKGDGLKDAVLSGCVRCLGVAEWRDTQRQRRPQ